MSLSEQPPFHSTIRFGVFLVFITGLLQTFSLPNFLFTGYSIWHSVLALVSFVPYIYIWRKNDWFRSFGYAWLMGFIYFTGTLAWVRLIGRNTNIDNAFAWLFFAACGGVYFGMFGAFAKILRQRFNWPDHFVLPIVWVAWEYLRGHILTGGWPWGSLGHTQYANPVLRQLASVVGVGGLSFLVLFINIILTDILEHILRHDHGFPIIWKNMPWTYTKWYTRFKKNPVQTITIICVLLLWFFSGIYTVIESIVFTKVPSTTLHVALLQGNIDTRQKWDQTYRENAMTKMSTLHLSAAKQNPDLIVWAESCFPGILEFEPFKKWEDQLRALIQEGGIPTVLTSNEYLQEKDLEKQSLWHHYNSAFYMGSMGQTLGRYRKIHLVPFGEYIPYNFLKRYLQTVVQEPVPIDFEPGDDYSTFALKGINFSVLICYEDIFEELGYQLAKEGADFFCSVANNSWSGNSAMSFQHTAMSVFLAVEHHAYVVKADMTGPTCIIDPWGNISDTLPYFTEGVKFVQIHPKQYKTFFTHFGNIFSFSIFILFITMLIPFFSRTNPFINL